MNEQRIKKIQACLTAALEPIELQVTDESDQHIGHEGAKSGKGHFHVYIVSDQFLDLSLIRRHRLIYAAIGDLMDTEIHALRIEAVAPTKS